MSKSLFVAEKPSVANDFAKALKISARKRDGYIEGNNTIITWCVGHLVTMSYPDAYDPSLKKWSMNTLPFLPKEFKYEVIPNVSKQFNIVKGLLNREDVETIYVCTDSGREGEYIYRLVDQMAEVSKNKKKKRIWIDSQTEDEILRGIREAKPLSEYDNLSEAAYLRAKEDYLMGINFSRVLSVKYGKGLNDFLKSEKWSAISVGRVMTCVLGMVVKREREFRDFVKTPFFRIVANMDVSGQELTSEFKAVEGSKYFASPLLHNDIGFLDKANGMKFISDLAGDYPKINVDGSWESFKTQENSQGLMAEVTQVNKRKERKNPPLLFNLAELQNDCSKMFKISPDETLKVAQELYEKKLITYPRTDARVLSTSVAKEISKHIRGVSSIGKFKEFTDEILANGTYKKLGKRYVDDSKVTDHYAIIPTGQGLSALNSVSRLSAKIYELIVRRFLSVFYPAAVYRRVQITFQIDSEQFFSSYRGLEDEGYLKVAKVPKKEDKQEGEADKEDGEEEDADENILEFVMKLKKGIQVPVQTMDMKAGETSPPKRYSSGTLILAMENAGQLIEDEELRAQIRGSGIGTSATRSEILSKLVKISYLQLNKKTQIISPDLKGELIYEVVNMSISSLLNPELTASWEKGLTYVAEGSITTEDYMKKLDGFVRRRVNGVKGLNNQAALNKAFRKIASYYK